MAGFHRISGVSALALALSLVAQGASAQTADDTAGLGEIVVTGSRIQVTGYSQPTPVTVVGEVELQRDAKVSIGDSIRELPAVGGGSPNNGVGANNIVGAVTGLDTVSLRNLGTSRTLVLLDSQRVAPSNIDGVVDMGTIPSILVQRVDVVTGGASAAWGSDAVAGVVNLVLNKQFDGIRASIEGGQSYAWDHRSYRLQFAAGTGFNDDRGRVIFAVNHMNSPDPIFASQRKWNTYRNLVNNPAYTPTNSEPRLIHMDNVGLSQATNGGLIMGPNCLTPLVGGVCANPNPLVGIQFVGPDGTPRVMDRGIVSGSTSAGGDGETDYPASNNLAVSYHTTNAFGYIYYDVTDNLRLSVQANYGRSWAKNNSTPATQYGNLTIQRDNAYLPDSIREQMVDLGLNSIQIGTTNMNNTNKGTFSYDNYVNNGVGIPVSIQKREMKRGVISLDGKIGDSWSWNAYYQHGEVKARVETQSNMVMSRYRFAVDSVLDPISGNIVCRATLAGDPAAAGCVPLNVFGEGVASQAAIRYVNVTPGDNYQVITMKQDVAAVSASGTLPFGLPAGDIALAFGGEYRSEKGKAEPDAGAIARSYAFANFNKFYGKYHVKEAFLEAEVPLLQDSFVNSLSLNAAGRVTDYSTSGRVETWKVGLTSEVNSLIRLRGTMSRDIRAPNLEELFSLGTPIAGATVVPGGASLQGFSTTTGNPDLKPEKADTISAGIVLSPAYGLNISADWYRIKLKDAILSVSGTIIRERCEAGEASFCEHYEYDSNGVFQQFRNYPRNLSQYEVSGVDFQADWRVPLFAGNLASRLVGNFVIKQSREVLGTTYSYAGSMGADSPVAGSPRLRANLSETYTQGPASFTVQGRFVSGGKLNYLWTEKDVDDNHIPAVFYVDLRGSYQLTDNAQIYAAVDNLLNKNPPNVAASWQQASSYFSTPRLATIHDQLGRAYRLGFRFNF